MDCDGTWYRDRSGLVASARPSGPVKARGMRGCLTLPACLEMQPQRDLGTFLDIDKIAALLAIGEVRTVRLEQAHRRAGSDPAIVLGDEAHHVAFMIRVGANYVEELDPGPEWRAHPADRSAPRAGG